MSRSGVLAGLFVVLQTMQLEPAATAVTGSYSVFRSQDRGRTWSRSAAGLPGDARINAFGVTSDTILAGTDRGIYLSHDQGTHWRASAGGAASFGRILSLATMGRSAFAGTDRGGVLTSLDGGVHWTENTPSPFRNVRSLLVHDGALYAGTDAQGVFRSQDAGRSWVSVSQGLPPGAQIFTMTASGGKVFAGLYSKGLYVWNDRERSWRRAGSVSPLALTHVGQTLLAGHNPGGIFRSEDAGITWTRSEVSYSADLGKAPVWELAAGPDLALAGISSRIYHSDDQGRTWISSHSGLPEGSSGIAFLVNPNYVLAGTFLPK